MSPQQSERLDFSSASLTSESVVKRRWWRSVSAGTDDWDDNDGWCEAVEASEDRWTKGKLGCCAEEPKLNEPPNDGLVE